MPAVKPSELFVPNIRTFQPSHLSHDRGLDNLLTSLDELKSNYGGPEKAAETFFVQTLFKSHQLKALYKLHQKLSEKNLPARHVTTNSYRIAAEAYDDLRSKPFSVEVGQLLDILLNPHVKALFEAHDAIATKDYVPKLPDIPHEVDEGETSLKIVRLVKNNESLGATIRLNEHTGSIYVARILAGGAADRSGLIHIGDVVWEVNGIDVRGMVPDDIVKILAAVSGPVTLKLVPGDINSHNFLQSKVKVKAHFNFDPLSDTLIPCQEAGLPFKKGDVLHIVSQSESDWWQARKEGDKNLRAGLVPSRVLQERREVASRNRKAAYGEGKQIKLKGMSPKSPGKHSPVLRKPKKAKKIMYELGKNEDFDKDEIVTYEEVEQLFPQPNRFRPVVMIGARGVGRNELKREILSSNPEHFKSTVPHTSRLPQPNEVHGKDYFFVSRDEMDKLIKENMFVEYGEYKGNLYSTSLNTVRSVLDGGHVCVMTPHPQSLKLLRNSELKPYVVFIKAPSIDVLQSTRLTSDTPLIIDETGQRAFTDEDFHNLIEQSNRIENVYGHYFDVTIINGELTTAVNELSTLVSRIEHEGQWVPASWVK